METNFFEGIAGLKFTGNLLLNINQNVNGEQTVSVMLNHPEVKPEEVNLPPLLFKGTAAELGAAFFLKLAEPVKATEGLFNNLIAYQQELEKAKKKTADKQKTAKAATAAKAATTSEEYEAEEDNTLFTPQVDDKTAKAEKKKLYDEAMEKVKKLALDTKYVEALANLPDPTDYPEKAEVLQSKRGELEKAKAMYENFQNQWKD